MALREGEGRLVAVGNSPKQVIENQLDNAGIAELFDGCYSAEQVGALKPAPAPYRFVLGAEDVPPERAVMVAAAQLAEPGPRRHAPGSCR